MNKFDRRLLVTDTDSLVYEIKGVDNVYEHLDKELFDFSGYDKSAEYYDDSNRKVIGKMKDEMGEAKLLLNLLG